MQVSFNKFNLIYTLNYSPALAWTQHAEPLHYPILTESRACIVIFMLHVSLYILNTTLQVRDYNVTMRKCLVMHLTFGAVISLSVTTCFPAFSLVWFHSVLFFDNSPLKTFFSCLLSSDNADSSLSLFSCCFSFQMQTVLSHCSWGACQTKINFSAWTLITLTAYADENKVSDSISDTQPAALGFSAHQTVPTELKRTNLKS